MSKETIMQGFETAFNSRLPKPQDQVNREQKKLACEQAITQLIYDLEADIGQEVVIGTILCQRKAQGNGHVMAHETRIELGV